MKLQVFFWYNYSRNGCHRPEKPHKVLFAVPVRSYKPGQENISKNQLPTPVSYEGLMKIRFYRFRS